MSTFIYKPGTRKGPVFLTPDTNDRTSPTFILSDGTRVEGRYLNTNEGRHQFVLPDSFLNQSDITVEYGGKTFTIANGKQSYEGSDLSAMKAREKGSVSENGTILGGSGPGGTTTTTIGGSTVVLPQGVDYSSLPLPNIDLNTAYEDAYTQGGRAQEELISSLSDPRVKDLALGIIDTDTQGILSSASELAPFNRVQGDLDNTTNIKRAGEIDTFNLNRIPKFNELNRNEKNKAVDSTGILYRDRINSYLDDIAAQAKGELPVGLDRQFTNQILDEGADIASSSGIGGGSRAGRANSARLNARERLAMMNNASARLGNELRASQQTLEAPIIQARPTEVPLTVSRVADRLPVVSSLSAGQIQQNLGKDLAALNSIDARTALSTNISTQQWNDTWEYNRAKTILDAEQGIITATENAVQSGFNQEKADAAAERQQLRNDFTEGIKMFGSVAGFLASPQGTKFLDYIFGPGTSTTQGNDVFQNDTTTTITNDDGTTTTETTTGESAYPIYTDTGDSSGGTLDSSTVDTGGDTSTVDTNTTYESGGVTESDILGDYSQKQVAYRVGNTTVKKSDVNGYQTLYNQRFGNIVAASNSLNSGTSKNLSSTEFKQARIQSLAKNPSAMGIRTASQKAEYNKNPEAYAAKYLKEQEANNPYVKASRPLTNTAQDLQLLGQGVDLVGNYNNRNAGQNIAGLGQFGANVLEQRGYIDGEEARNVRATATALQVLSNPNTTDAQRAAAIAELGAVAATDGYTGDISNPVTIGGQRVISSTTNNGSKEYTLADGSVVSQDYLANVQSSINGIRAIGVLTSNASTQDKMLALTSIGIDTARAQQIISQQQAGYGNAALSILGTTLNWDKMNTVQKSVSIIQTGVNIAEVMGASTANTGATVGTSTTTTTGLTAGTASTNTTNSVITAGTASGTSAASTSAASAGGTTATKAGADAAAGSAGSGVTALGAAQTALGYYGIYVGTKGGLEHIDAMSDQNRSNSGSNAGIGAANGASVGAAWGPWGALIGGVLGAVGGLVGTFTASTKDRSQMMRDTWRKGLKESGIIEVDPTTKKHNVTLANGEKYDIGIDGSTKITNNGTQRYSFDVDWNSKLAVQAVPAGNLFSIATGIDPTSGKEFDMFSRTAAQSINAATSNAKNGNDIYANYRAMLKNKITPDQLGVRLEYLRATNKISEAEYGVYLDQTNKMFGTKYKPTDRKQANVDFVNSILLKAPKDRTKEEKTMLEELTNKEKRAEQRKVLLDRINKERKEAGQSPIESLGYEDVDIGDVDLGTDSPVGTATTAQTQLLTSQTKIKEKDNSKQVKFNNIKSAPGKPKAGQPRIDAKPFVRLDNKKLKVREGVRPTYGK